ncbi:MAG: VWA domain-containing protein [Spirochaetes bacterium]|nr:VWA domain-containing protein [Spirochaetota bacterium]
MRFYQPQILYYLIIVPVVYIFFLLSDRRKKKTLKELGDADRLDRFATKRMSGGLLTQGAVICAAFLFFVLALARPQAGTRLEPVTVRGSDLYIAIDLSMSMTVEDVKPNRLERAKLDALEIVRSLSGDRVGLILFAQDAFVQCPLTNDYEAVGSFISSLSSSPGESTAEAGGTSLEAPLSVALDSLQTGEETYAIVVLLTDGESTVGDHRKTLQAIKRRGIRVFCIGIGTMEGAPIPLYDESGGKTGYKKDKTGKVVISTLRDDILRSISRETSGAYYQADRTVDEAKKMIAAVRDMKKRDLQTKRFTVYEDRFQIPLGAGIWLFLLYVFLLTRRSGGGVKKTS